jgi:hypothetical protein
MIDWLSSFNPQNIAKAIEDDAMFCRECEAENGLYYLMHNGGKHVCAVEEDE